MIAEVTEGEEVDRWMLHIRKTGMKSVRAKERVSKRLSDQMTKREKEQT